MDELIETVAEAIWRANPHYDIGAGFRFTDMGSERRAALRVQARAALDALKAAGYAMVELPEASYTHTDSDLSCERGLEWDTASGPLRAFEDGHVEWDGDRSSVDEFRHTAAAFLAAARAAEAAQ